MTPFLAALVAVLLGLAVGKAWERYKLQEGRWIDRRRNRESPHYTGAQLPSSPTSSIWRSTMGQAAALAPTRSRST
jgi:hypothetical protein